MKLKIYFSADWHNADSPCPWALCSESGSVVQTGTGPLASLPKSDENVAVISASRLTCISASMPTHARRRWESALPYVAEEYTITDPDENHVVPGAIQKDGKRSLFIVDKQWMQDIVSACNKAGITLRYAIPEILLVNLPTSGWGMVWDGHRGFIRTGEFSGMVLDYGDAESPPQTLALILNAARPALPAQILLHPLTGTDGTLPAWAGMPSPLALGKAWDWRTAPIPDGTLNLLWGTFAPKTRLNEWLPRLRPLAFILLAALAIETVGVNLQWALLSHERRIISQTMEHTFRQTFGNDVTVINPALQMQRKISALRHSVGTPDEADFLALLDLASGPLAMLPAGSITAMHYEPGVLSIDIKQGNDAELGVLQEKFKQTGLNVHASDIHNTAGNVETRLTIQTGDFS